MRTDTHPFLSISDKAQQCIGDAWKLTIGFYSGETLSKIEAWRLQVSGMTSLYSLFRSNELANFVENVFSNEFIRDFIIKLSINFHVRFEANQTIDYNEVLNLFATSIDQNSIFENKGDSTCLIPDVLLKRLPTLEEIHSALAGNKWLVTIVAMILYIPVNADKTAGMGRT